MRQHQYPIANRSRLHSLFLSLSDADQERFLAYLERENRRARLSVLPGGNVAAPVCERAALKVVKGGAS